MPHQDLIIDGIKWASVTDVLGDRPKPWLDAWKEKWGVLADRKTKAATNVGTAFHEAAEKLAKGEIVHIPTNRRLAAMLLKFEQWLIASGLTVKETELHVVSKAYKYHGTFDATGYTADLPGIFTIFDWKTSKGIKPEAEEQLAAYAQAYEEQTGIKVRRGIVVNVLKQKPHHKLAVKEYKLNKRVFNRFLKRLKEYNEARGA